MNTQCSLVLAVLSVASAANMIEPSLDLLVPNLFKDILDTNLMSKCKLHDVKSITAEDVRELESLASATFNLSPLPFCRSVSLVLNVNASETSLAAKRYISININGEHKKLLMHVTPRSVMVWLDVPADERHINVTIDKATLTEIGTRVHEIYVMVNLRRECAALRSLRITLNRIKRLTRRQAEHQATKNRRVKSSACGRKKFVVRFSDISEKLDSSIVYPPTVDIGMCHGTCLSHHCNFNGIIRHFISGSNSPLLKSRDDFTMPQCVPTKFEEVQALYYNPETRTVQSRSFENLVVSKCSCL